MLGQFVRSTVHHTFAGSSKPSALPEAVLNVLYFTEMFCKYASIPRSTLEGYIPAYIMACMKA